MQGLKRKIVYAIVFEVIAIAITTTALASVSDHGAGHAGIAAVATSAIAMVWNLLYNTLFEAWEARQSTRTRGLARRVAHAAGFEGGLLLILVPLLAWWIEVSLWQAFVLDIGLSLFFLVYTFVFNWLFDLLFGLPASARADAA